MHFTDDNDDISTSSAPRRTTLTLLGALCAAPAAWLAGCASPAPAPAPAVPARRPAPAPAPAPRPAPSAARSWDEYKLQVARRLVAANPTITYTSPAPDPLLAIPVLELELRADGSVARIDIRRHPTQAKDTTQIAIDAIRRAAPFGDVSHLPKPWKFVETFLFDDDRRFKPMTLDR